MTDADAGVYPGWRDTLTRLTSRFDRLAADTPPVSALLCRTPRPYPDPWQPDSGDIPPELGSGRISGPLWLEGLSRGADVLGPAVTSHFALYHRDRPPSDEWRSLMDDLTPLLNVMEEAGNLLTGLPLPVMRRLWPAWALDGACNEHAAGLWLDALCCLAWNPPPGPLVPLEWRVVYPLREPLSRQRGDDPKPWPAELTLPLPPWHRPPGLGGCAVGEYLAELPADADPFAPPPGSGSVTAVRWGCGIGNVAALSATAADVLTALAADNPASCRFGPLDGSIADLARWIKPGQRKHYKRRDLESKINNGTIQLETDNSKGGRVWFDVERDFLAAKRRSEADADG